MSTRRRLPRVIKVDTASPKQQPPATSSDPLNPAQRAFFEEIMAMDDEQLTDEFIAEAMKDEDKAEVIELMNSMVPGL